MKFIQVNEHGVTLIELLLAMSLLTIVLVTFMGFFTNAFQYNSMSAKKVKGIHFLREGEVDLRGNPEIQTFLQNIDTSKEVTPTILLKSTYPELPLKNDITTVDEFAKPQFDDETEMDDEDIDRYYLLELDQSPYTLCVYVKDTPDVGKLYRVFIETYGKEGKLLSETYTYIEVNNEGNS